MNKLVGRLFNGFSIQRWNDFIRPLELTEMDKCAHKMVVAFCLGRIEEKKGASVDWLNIIDGGIFELLKKLALSDIKAPVHRKIAEDYPTEFKALNDWVVQQYDEITSDSSLLSGFREYLHGGNRNSPSFRILRAAHKYTTYREFEPIKLVNLRTSRLERVERELLNDLYPFSDLEGVQMLLTRQPLADFIDQVEQLRYQYRWSQTQRIPRTSVLGHSVFVAIVSYLWTRRVEPTPAPQRLINNFFAGLFHDLPEAVTRDIISPVKRATENLPGIIKDVEDEIVSKELVPLMHESFKDRLKYFTENEFANKVRRGSDILDVTFEQYTQYNTDSYDPVDGEIVELADKFAAFLEAHFSIVHGVTSQDLVSARHRMYEEFTVSSRTVYGLATADLFRSFKLHEKAATSA